jgi:hypothetical protein
MIKTSTNEWINIDHIIYITQQLNNVVYDLVDEKIIAPLGADTLDDIMARIRVARRERHIRTVEVDDSAYDIEGWPKGG